LAVPMYAQLVSFGRPMKPSRARVALRRAVENPLELWGRNKNDVMQLARK